LPTSNPT